MKSILSLILTLFFVSCSSLSVNNDVFALKKEITNYSELQTDVEKIAKEYSPENILVVFDVDNTMLKNNIELGSEQWFYWQESLLNTNSNQKVAKDFNGLLRVQGLLFDIDPMKLTDENVDEVLASFQDKNMKTIVLTSRGPDFRGATERTLFDHGLNFSKAKIGEDIGGSFIPYSVENLSTEEKGFVNNREARPVSYMNGIYMTSGQHKGVMLESLLSRFDYEPEVIIFIDNHEKQTNRVFEQFEGRKNVVVFRYAGFDKTYKSFESKKLRNKADRDWKTLKKSLDSIFKVSVP